MIAAASILLYFGAALCMFQSGMLLGDEVNYKRDYLGAVVTAALGLILFVVATLLRLAP